MERNRTHPLASLARAAAATLRGGLDLLYPPHCFACAAPLPDAHPPLCTRCLESLRPVEHACPRCGTPRGPHGPPEADCPSCRRRTLHFDTAAGAFPYEDPVKRLIHRLKFESFLPAGELLGRITAKVFAEHPLRAGAERIAPVPLDRKSLRRRGTNQAERIARHIARATGIPLVHALRKSETTAAQVDLPRALRLQNPAGAFAPGRHIERVRGRTVVLVDDVLTTGATCAECARVLKEAGAASVRVFAVARQAL